MTACLKSEPLYRDLWNNIIKCIHCLFTLKIQKQHLHLKSSFQIQSASQIHNKVGLKSIRQMYFYHNVSSLLKSSSGILKKSKLH